MWKTLNRGLDFSFFFFPHPDFPGALPPSPVFFKEQASATSPEAPQIECSEGWTEGLSAMKNCNRGSSYIIQNDGVVRPLMGKKTTTHDPGFYSK